MPAVASADTPAAPVEDVSAPAPGEPGAAAAAPVGYGALPGGLHVASAEALPAGTVELSLVSGYGYRKGLLGSAHTMTRALGQVAIGYAPIPRLMLGLSFDGRYDSHDHLDVTPSTDNGYVGDPHVLVRYASPVGRVLVGGQLNIWVPGKDAPSLALSATSVDARGLVSIAMGFGTLSVDAGFRFDNSADSVENEGSLSNADQVSLGVSKFNAVLGGGALRVPLGRAYLELEGSTEVFAGSGAPGPIVRGGGAFGVALNDAFTAIGFLEAAHVPRISAADRMANAIPLVPYEPVITGGLGIQARFGAQRARPKSQVTVNTTPAPVTVLETADVSGIVFDDAGKPVVAAQVTVKLKNHTGNAVTDSKGAYAVAKLPIGKTVDGKTELDDTGAEVTAEVANKKPGTATLTLGKGANPVPPITLESNLPPGQLRAVITHVGNGRPVAGATVTVEPGGVTATSGADGKFTVDLPPGRYKLTVTARGLAQQQLDVTIEQNGVAIKNIELHK